MQRRRFLAVVGAVGALATGALACGGDDGGGGPTGPDGGGPSVPVSNDDASGHRHTFELRCADLGAGRARSYPTDGVDHQHTVLVSAAELDQLAAGATVTITFIDGHAHTFVIAPPGDAC